MRRPNAILSIALTALLAACSTGVTIPPPDRQDNSPAPPDIVQPAQPEQVRTVLNTSMPVLAALAPGSQFDFTVSVDLAEPLYQASGRVVYDPALFEPLAAERGGLIAAQDVFIAPLTSPPADSLPPAMAAVPFAFTRLPGAESIPAGNGELLRVRFRIKGVPDSGRAVYLLNEPEFLQLRDSDGRRLPFDLATAEVAQ